MTKAVDWYKDAVFYEVPIRSFCDGNGDGFGDFHGLISRLDYIADLGVTAIWLLPFYPSPFLDGAMTSPTTATSTHATATSRIFGLSSKRLIGGD